jgi:hypothetical protein
MATGAGLGALEQAPSKAITNNNETRAQYDIAEHPDPTAEENSSKPENTEATPAETRVAFCLLPVSTAANFAYLREITVSFVGAIAKARLASMKVLLQ